MLPRLSGPRLTSNGWADVRMRAGSMPPTLASMSR